MLPKRHKGEEEEEDWKTNMDVYNGWFKGSF